MRWYENLIASDEWRMAAKNSFIVAPSATVVATVLGTLAAIGLTKADFRGKGLLMAVLLSPMIVPVVVVGVGMYLFFAPLGSRTPTWADRRARGARRAVRRDDGGRDTARLQPEPRAREPVARRESGVDVLPRDAAGDRTGCDVRRAVRVRDVVRRSRRHAAGADQTTLPRQMFTGIRENISPTIAALATILIIFSTSLLLALEWLRGRNARRAVT